MDTRIGLAREGLFEQDLAVREFERFLVEVYQRTRH